VTTNVTVKAVIFTRNKSWLYCGRGCQGQMDKKCQIAHQNMPNGFKKCKTNWNRHM